MTIGTETGPRVHRAWLWYLVAMAVLSVAYLFGPKPVHSGPVFNLIGASAVVAILAGSRRNGVRHRATWHLFALGQALFVAGDVIAYNYRGFFHTDLPFPSIADVLYLAVYPSLLVGLLILIRKRTPGNDRRSLIDSVIISVGLGMLSWVFLMAPYIHDPDLSMFRKLISIAYPLMDVLLLAVLVRLAVGSGKKEPAFHLLTLGVVALLATDAIYGWTLLHGNYTPGSLMDVGWIAFYLLWGAAALHPSMRSLGEPSPQTEPEVGRRRLLLLAGASLIAPVVLVYLALRGETQDVVLLGACSALLFVLVLMRMNGLMVDVREHRRVERELRATEVQLIVDITEETRRKDLLHEALEVEKSARQRLEELDAMKDSFLQAVSHDLRTPLTTILGVALTLERDDGTLGPKDSRELIGSVARNARKLHRLLTDLLDVERMSHGMVGADRAPVALRELVLAVVDELDLGDHRVLFQGGNVVAHLDRVKVERILDNLVANAVRYTPPGTRIWIAVERRDQGVLITVEDEGPGVPAEIREQIFEPFRQGREVVRHSPGVGIGLSLVARFAAAHGGRVWVEDRAEGPGASFKVLLPDGKVGAASPGRSVPALSAVVAS